MPATIHFDPDTHCYSLDDREIRSVTQRIARAGLLGSAPTWHTPEAAERGTAVHLACHQSDIGAELDICAEWDGYLRSYQAWSRAMAPTWTSMEQPYYNAELDLAGTPDRIGTMAGRDVVLDIKSGPPASWHGIQLAAYDLLVPLPHRRRRIGLYLDAHGDIARMKDYRASADYVIALTLCTHEETPS